MKYLRREENERISDMQLGSVPNVGGDDFDHRERMENSFSRGGRVSVERSPGICVRKRARKKISVATEAAVCDSNATRVSLPRI